MSVKPKYYSLLLLLTVQFTDLLAQTGVYEVERVNAINESSSDDNSPVINKGGLVFISNRRRGVIDNYQFIDNNGNVSSGYNYYFSPLVDGSFGTPEILDIDLATRSSKGPFIFSADGKTMYFTKNLLEPRRLRSSGKDNPAGIFTAKYNGEHWAEIMPFPFCTGKYNYGCPALSPDGKRLYFASDTTDGYGGFDIWYCEFKDGKWNSPVNLGPKINTKGDEGFPYCHPTGRLYFSYKPPGTRGKSHIFYTQQIKGEWIQPVPLPDPFSGRFGYKCFVADSALNSGYFVEERRGVGDIYSFRSIVPQFETCKAIEEPRLCFTFFDKAAPLLDTLSMMYEWDFGGGQKVRGAEAYRCFPGIGKYKINLNVIDKATGQLYFSEASYDFTIEDLLQVRINSPKECEVNQSVQLSASNSGLKNIEVEQYFWDFDDLDKAAGPAVTHIFKRPGKYTVSCGIKGTDAQKNDVKVCSVVTIEVRDFTINR